MKKIIAPNSCQLSVCDVACLIIVLAMVFIMPSLAGDPGVGWHLRTGEWIVQHLAIPYADPFLATTEGRLWIANQWLSDVILWSVLGLGGWGLLHLFVVALVIVAFWMIPGGLLREQGRGEMTVLVVLLIVTLLGGLQWLVRPVIFSFLFFSVLLSTLIRHLESDGRVKDFTYQELVFIPLLFLIWANSHSAFPLGLIALGLLSLVALVRNKERSVGWKLALTTTCATAATLVNPFGFELHRNIFALVGDPFFMRLNMEWYPPDFTDILFLPFFLFVLLFALLLLSRSRTKVHLYEAGLVLIFLLLAFNGRRYIPFLALVIAAPFARVLEDFVTRLFSHREESRYSLGYAVRRVNLLESRFPFGTFTGLVFMAVLGLTLLSGNIPFRNVDELGIDQHHPRQAVDLIVQGSPSDLVLHHPDLGGYLIWRRPTAKHAFIDDRNELNGQAKYEEYRRMAKLESGWQETFARYNFRWILLRPEAPLAKGLRREQLLSPSRWERLYEDHQAVLWRRLD